MMSFQPLNVDQTKTIILVKAYLSSQYKGLVRIGKASVTLSSFGGGRGEEVGCGCASSNFPAIRGISLRSTESDVWSSKYQ